MAGVNLATAYLSIVPSFDGVQGAVNKELFGPLQEQAGGAGEDAGGKSGKAFVVAAGAAILAGAAAVGAALKGLYEVGGIFDDVADTIRVGTGKSGDALQGLADVAKKVATTVPVDFQTAGQTVADLNTRLGLSGDSLTTVASQFVEAGRILGEDVDVNSASAALNAFGVTGDQVSSKMDVLFRVSQATGVGMNELTAATSAQAPALQALGFGFDETISLMGTMDKAGLNASAVTASMSKGLVTLAKDGEQPAEAFKRVTGELGDLVAKGDTAAAINLASGIFGTRGATQFVGAVQSGALNLNDLTAAANETGDTILGLGAETADAAESWQLLKNRGLAALEPLGTAVFGLAGEGMSKLADAVGPVAEKFAAFSTGALGKLPEIFKSIGDVAGPVFQQIFDTVGPILKEVGGTLGQAFLDVWQSLKPALEPLLPLLPQLLTAFNPIGLLFKALLPLLPQIADIIGQLARVIGDALGQALIALTPLFQAVVDVINRLLPFITQLVASLLPPLMDLFSRLAPILDLILAALMPVVDALVAALVPAIEALMPIVERVFGFIADTIGNVLAVITGIIDVIIGVFTGDWSRAWEGIKAIFGAVWDQMRDAVSFVWDAISLIISTAWGFIRDTIFAPMGEALGVVGGWFSALWDKVSEVWQWIQDKIAAVWTWIDVNVFAPIGVGVAAVGQFFSDLWAKVSEVWQFIQDKLAAVWAWIDANVFTPLKAGVQAVMDFFGFLWDKVSQVWQFIQDKIAAVWAWIDANVFAPLKSGVQLVMDFFGFLWDKVNQVWQFIQDKIAAVWVWVDTNVFGPLKSGVQAVMDFFGFLWDKVNQVWQAIQDKVSAVWNWVNDNIFTPLKNGIQSIMDFFGNLWDKVVEVWDKIKAKIQDVWDNTISPIWDTLKGWISSVGEFFGKIVEAIETAVGKIGEFLATVKKTVSDFWDWLTNAPVGGTAVKAGNHLPTQAELDGSARGGVIPGRDPGRRDNQLRWMRSEEAVMVPEWQRAVGGAPTIHRWNRAAEQGRLGDTMRQDIPGLALGGVVGAEDRINAGIQISITDPVMAAIQAAADAAMARAAESLAGGFTGSINPSQDPSSFGWQRAQGIVPFSWNGHAFVGGVADRTQGLWTGLMDALVPQIPGGIMAPIWAYENRNNVNSPGNASFHSYGLAADINAPQNPNGVSGYGRSGQGVIPSGPAHALASRFGMIWGGDFTGTPDPMHFEIHVSPDQITGGGPPGVEGGPFPPMVERWRPLGLDVLGKVGQYRGTSLTQHIDRMLNQIRTESSGDPNAINNTDINAQRGDPSIGLLQVIGSTFRAALSGTPFANLIAAGQRDPRASLTASTLYSLNRYGSLDKAWRGVAYDMGGWMEPGVPAFNLLNRPEAVLTPPQSDALITHARDLEAGFRGITPGDLAAALSGPCVLTVDGQSFRAYVDRRADVVLGENRRAMSRA